MHKTTASRARGLAAALIALSAAALAAPMPEFGPSVQFDPAGPQPLLAKLRGKAVIMLFFQSGDKSSDSWSGKFIQEMEEAYADNPAVVLIALKTDSGGPAAAKGYFAAKKAKPDLWIVGSDADAKYATSITGDPLWFYVLVGADGSIIERGKAGVSHTVTVGPDKKREKRFNLADPKLIKKCGAIATALPAGKRYDSSVAPLVRLTELGDAEKAFTLANGMLARPKEKQAATDLLADLQPLVERRITERVALLADTAAASAARYTAFNELTQMVKDLKGHALANKAGPALSKAKLDPALQREARAEAAYKTLLPRIQRATERDKPRLAKELEAFAKQHDGTQAGQLAADTAQEFAASAP